jgi:hypothetical protein
MADDDGLSFGDDLLDTVFESMGDWASEDYSDAAFEITDVVEAFWTGFVDPNASEDDAADARSDFFDFAEYFGYDLDDFDWESWREWYSES